MPDGPLKHSEQTVKPPNYETFRNQTRNEGLMLVLTEGAKISYGALSDRWDDFEPDFAEFHESVLTVTHMLQNECKKTGIVDIPNDPRIIENASLRELVIVAVESDLSARDTASHFGKTADRKAELEDIAHNPITASRNHTASTAFYNSMVELQKSVLEYHNVLLRIPGPIRSTPEVTESAEKTEKTFGHMLSLIDIDSTLQTAISFSRQLYSDQNILFHQSLDRKLQQIGQLAIGDVTKSRQELIQELDEYTESTLRRWLDTEPGFLNMDSVPVVMREKIHDFIEQRDPVGAPLPTCIVGASLEALISPDLDPAERTTFMTLYTLRSLLEWDDGYLSEVYEEKYGDTAQSSPLPE